MKESNACVVLCTLPLEADARALATSLVEKHLAACVNIISQLTSIYRWQGKIEEGSEQLLVIKTTEEQFEALAKAIKALHPYQVPEIIALPIQTGWPDYLKWLSESMK